MAASRAKADADMDCLDEETILGFCRGKLPAAVRASAEEHIGTCDECRALVSAVARSSFVDTPSGAAKSSPPLHGHPAHVLEAATNLEHTPIDFKPGPLLRARVDLGMAPTTPIGDSGSASGPASSPVHPGQILAGKFEVERVLGAGGMGIVVAARHTQLDQRVALKFLLPIACEVPGAVARFLREGKAAARITSEHVARVKDTGMLEGGAPYLVMEYLEGSDLGALVQKRGRVPADEAIEWVLQACEAIVEAHDLGIIHRDLKPANLFLSRRADGSPLVKVLDFGISKIEGGGSRSEMLTSASVLMGSPRYMSPEQMLSAKDVDVRTDVWALGVILYELVTGKPVWNADTVQGLCALIASSPAPSLLLLAPDAPRLLDDVVSRCLTKKRDDRLASVADLALALEPIAPDTARTSIERILRVARRDRAAGGLPRSQRPPPPSAAAPVSEVTAPEVRRASTQQRIVVVLAVAVAVLLVAGIALNAALAQRAAQPTRLVQAEPSATSLTSASVPAPTASVASAATLVATASASSTPPAVTSAVASPATAQGRHPFRPLVAPSATTPPEPPVVVTHAPDPKPPPSSRALTDRK